MRSPTLVVWLLVLTLSCCVALADLDPLTGTIADQRWASGVPLGGIGCGSVEVLTDGAFGYVTTNHNWDRPTGVLKGAFAAVRVKSGDATVAKLLRRESAIEYEGVGNVAGTRYLGMYPRAEVDFVDPELPVRVSLHAYSPLIPRNVKDSALPVAFLDFTVENPADAAASVSIAISWENLIGFGGRRDVNWDFSDGRNQEPLQTGGWNGLVFANSEQFDDMRQNTIGEHFLGVQEEDGVGVSVCPQWDADGSIDPLWQPFVEEGRLGPITSSEEPARKAGAVAATCDLSPGETRTLRFLLAWHMPTFRMVHQVSEFTGEFGSASDAGLSAFDGDLETRWGTQRGKKPGDQFTLDLGRVETVSSLTLDSSPSPQDYPRGYTVELATEPDQWAEVASATATEAAKRQVDAVLEITFAPQQARFIRVTNQGSEDSWWWSIHELSVRGPEGALDLTGATATQRLAEMVTEQRQDEVGHYFLNFFDDLPSLLGYALANRERLLDETRDWQQPVMDSNLPFWLKLKLINCAYTMSSATVLTRDGRFAVQESPVHMGGALGTMDQRMAAHAFYVQMFPSLDASELRLFDQCQREDGRITHFNGNFHEVIGDPRVGYGITDWPDLSASWIMQVLKLYRWTGDRALLDEMWPGIRDAIAWLESADADGDLIPEGGSTYDYEQLPPGAFIYSASCYLGALLAAEEAAKVVGETQTAGAYRARFLAVRRAVMDRLWNGQYFIKWRAAEGDKVNPNSFVAALAGDWLARLCGLQDTLSRPIIDKELEQLIARHLNSFFPVPPMEVTAEGKVATGACFLLQHEPYLGCESIYRGYVDQGLEVLRRVYHCAWVQNQDPWHQSLAYGAPGGGQGGLRSYMTCPTSWHVLNAMTGVSLDAPGKTLYISPRAQSETGELHCPVFLSTFWAWVDYVPAQGTLTFTVTKTFEDCQVEIARVGMDGNGLMITLQEPFVIEEGASLDLSKRIAALAPYPTSRYVDWQVKPSPLARPGLSPAGWTVQTHVPDGAESSGEGPDKAVDGDESTRWSTQRGMSPGDWFQVDLGEEQRIMGVWAEISASKRDYPRGYDVLVSLDGENWEIALSAGEGPSRRAVRHGIWRAEFNPVTARYVRIVQKGSEDYWWWSIHELYVLPEGYKRPRPPR